MPDSEPPEPDPRRSAPPASDHEGWLGDFRRGPALFSVHKVVPSPGDWPLGPADYRITCDDGPGAHDVCRYTDEPEAVPEWHGAWNGDEWCDWIIANAKRLIAKPENT